MPHVELTEERKPLASTAGGPGGVRGDVPEGAEASQFVKRPLLRRTLIAATVPLRSPRSCCCGTWGRCPGRSLRHTVWRKGLRLVISGPNIRSGPADFGSPGGDDHGDPRGTRPTTTRWPRPRDHHQVRARS